MDPFDTKINKMKQDIDLIKNEIHDIQKVNMIFITINQKNKENKQSLTKSINSLSSTQHNIKHHHQHKPKLNNGDEHRNKNHFNLIYIKASYSNSNYQIKDKEAVTREVLITNY